MYLKNFHKVLSVAIAHLVLLSTISFTMEKHYCGDTLIDVAIFSKVTTCDLNMDTIAKVSPEKKSCCKDELEVVKGQDKLKKASIEDLQFPQQLFFSSLIYSFTNLFEGLPQRLIPHRDYSPPNLVADIQVLGQVFII